MARDSQKAELAFLSESMTTREPSTNLPENPQKQKMDPGAF